MHSRLLRWGAHETGRTIDLRAVSDPTIDPGLPGGRELVALARAANAPRPDRRPFEAVANVLGANAACEAVGVAANYQIMSRIGDAIGMPMAKDVFEDSREIIALLKLDQSPRAASLLRSF